MRFKNIFIGGMLVVLVYFMATTRTTSKASLTSTSEIIDLGSDAHEKSTIELEMIVREQLEKELNTKKIVIGITLFTM